MSGPSIMERKRTLARYQAAHKIDIGKIHDLKARVAELEALCREVRGVLLKLGEWDEGCFYFQGKTCSELERPLRLLGEPVEGPSAGQAIEPTKERP